MVSYINRPRWRNPLLGGIAILVISLSFITSCKKKSSPEDVLMNNIREAGKLYLTKDAIDPTIVQNIDTVNHIDTVSSLGYAILMKEALTSMQANFEYEYKEAVFEDNNIAIREIELSMTEIEYMLEYFDMLLNNGDLHQDNVLLLWISAQFVSQGQSHNFDYLTNPDGTLHELDPFDNNLLDKEFAAE
ncbi:MAG: hypothetical protein LBV02_04570 [Bacteroidales bacterium]|jgi:hypothetical protein|nr:hypothetical protein [Bacteroidales bacterium]